MNLRKDLGSHATTVATAKHGDRLEVLEVRRRFVRVRTEQGVEGWTDSTNLLGQQQVDDLNHLAEVAKKLPSQGTATVYDALNIHTAPSRQSPSVAQIPGGGSIEVIGHKVSPRVAASAPVVKAAPKKAAKAPPKKKAQAKEPVIPPPPAPPAPENLQELSRPRASDLAEADPSPTAVTASTAMDDWYLVRTADGKAGWVLARQVVMSIPDEVAQYAEGHAITSYASLGEVGGKEDSTTKHYNWLWTTSSASQKGYEFDSFRVFVWSTKKHRYETAFVERNVKGYYPVETQDLPGDLPGGGEKGFSVVTEDKDGQVYKRTFGFTGYHVRMISKTPASLPPPVPEVRTAYTFDASPAQQPSKESGWNERLKALRKRLFGQR